MSNSKKMIWIPMDMIRISILEGLLEDMDSNLDSKKSARTNRFEYPLYRFKSFSEEVEIRSKDLNPSQKGFNSLWRFSSKNERGRKRRRIRISLIRIRIQDLEKWRTHEESEFSQERFESILQNEASIQRSRHKDSNFWVSDLNLF